MPRCVPSWRVRACFAVVSPRRRSMTSVPLASLKIRLGRAATVLALSLATSALLAPAQAQRRAAPSSREAVQLSFAPIVKMAAPAVVNVYVRGKPQQNVQRQPPIDDPVFRRFFGEL